VTAFDQNLITRGRAHLFPTSTSDAITVTLSRPVNQGQRSAQGEPEFLRARDGREADGWLFPPGTRGGFGGQRASGQGHAGRRGRPRRARRRPGRPPAGGPV